MNIRAELPPDAIEQIVAETTRRVLAEISTANAGRWLTGAAAAADYLGCSPKRVYNRRHDIPHVRDSGRFVFHTRDLDQWLRAGRG